MTNFVPRPGMRPSDYQAAYLGISGANYDAQQASRLARTMAEATRTERNDRFFAMAGYIADRLVDDGVDPSLAVYNRARRYNKFLRRYTEKVDTDPVVSGWSALDPTGVAPSSENVVLMVTDAGGVASFTLGSLRKNLPPAAVFNDTTDVRGEDSINFFKPDITDLSDIPRAIGFNDRPQLMLAGMAIRNGINLADLERQ